MLRFVLMFTGAKPLFLSVFCWTVLVAACGQLDPDEVRAKQGLPPIGFVADADKGKTLFGNHCAGCHGKHGKGTTQGPPLVHKIYAPSHHADMTFYRAAKDGVRSHHWQFGDMRPVKTVKPEDVSHIVAYVRQEQRRHGIR